MMPMRHGSAYETPSLHCIAQIYQELAQQKKEKEDRERQNAPKQRNYEKEHADSLRAIREKEEAAGVRYLTSAAVFLSVVGWLVDASISSSRV